MVRTSLNSFVVLISRFLRSSTTVVEWLVVSLDMFPLSFLELQRSWRSTTAEFNVVMSCLISAVSSWISIVGSSKTEVLFATGNHDANIKVQSENLKNFTVRLYTLSLINFTFHMKHRASSSFTCIKLNK